MPLTWPGSSVRPGNRVSTTDALGFSCSFTNTEGLGRARCTRALCTAPRFASSGPVRLPARAGNSLVRETGWCRISGFPSIRIRPSYPWADPVKPSAGAPHAPCRRNQQRAAAFRKLVRNILLLQRLNNGSAIAVGKIAVQNAVFRSCCPNQQANNQRNNSRHGNHQRDILPGAKQPPASAPMWGFVLSSAILSAAVPCLLIHYLILGIITAHVRHGAGKAGEFHGFSGTSTVMADDNVQSRKIGGES